MLIKARISLTRLKEPGKLTLASKKNINTSRKIESIKLREPSTKRETIHSFHQSKQNEAVKHNKSTNQN